MINQEREINNKKQYKIKQKKQIKKYEICPEFHKLKNFSSTS